MATAMSSGVLASRWVVLLAPRSSATKPATGSAALEKPNRRDRKTRGAPEDTIGSVRLPYRASEDATTAASFAKDRSWPPLPTFADGWETG